MAEVGKLGTRDLGAVEAVSPETTKGATALEQTTEGAAAVPRSKMLGGSTAFRGGFSAADLQAKFDQLTQAKASGGAGATAAERRVDALKERIDLSFGDGAFDKIKENTTADKIKRAVSGPTQPPRPDDPDFEAKNETFRSTPEFSTMMHLSVMGGTDPDATLAFLRSQGLSDADLKKTVDWMKANPDFEANATKFQAAMDRDPSKVGRDAAKALTAPSGVTDTAAKKALSDIERAAKGSGDAAFKVASDSAIARGASEAEAGEAGEAARAEAIAASRDAAVAAMFQAAQPKGPATLAAMAEKVAAKGLSDPAARAFLENLGNEAPGGGTYLSEILKNPAAATRLDSAFGTMLSRPLGSSPAEREANLAEVMSAFKGAVAGDKDASAALDALLAKQDAAWKDNDAAMSRLQGAFELARKETQGTKLTESQAKEITSQVQESMKQIGELQRSGKFTEAQKVAAELSAKLESSVKAAASGGADIPGIADFKASLEAFAKLEVSGKVSGEKATTMEIQSQFKSGFEALTQRSETFKATVSSSVERTTSKDDTFKQKTEFENHAQIVRDAVRR